MDAESHVTVGAIMPTYNQAEFIAAAIDSVAPQVDSLVVVNDGGQNIEHLIDGATVHVCHLENLGTAEAINTGLRMMYRKVEWLTWVSSDNTYVPHWMETLKAQIAPDVGVIYSGFWYEKPGRKPLVLSTPYDPTRLIADQNCFFGPSFIIRADVWQPHRGRISHDYDNWLRVEEACWERDLRIVGVDADLCAYNAHDQRVTVTRKHLYDVPKWRADGKARRARMAADCAEVAS